MWGWRQTISPDHGLEQGSLGVPFDEAWSDRKSVVSDGLPIGFLGMATYRKNKRASGRPKDLADLDALPDPET
jgi:hypothetical protein